MNILHLITSYYLWLLLIIILVVVALMFAAMFVETQKFNKGICKKCGTKLTFYKNNFERRIYLCRNCGHMVRVEWSNADTNF